MTFSTLSGNRLTGGANPYLKVVDVTSTTGTPTITPSGIYTIYSFTGSGSITLGRAGLCSILVVGGGGGGSNYAGRTAGGGAGYFYEAITSLSMGSQTVTIGAGGANGSIYGSLGGTTVLGSLKSGGGYIGIVANTIGLGGYGGGGSSGGFSMPDAGAWYGGGAGGAVWGTNQYDGRVSTITGSSVTYAAAQASGSAGTANRGEGGGLNAAGGSGIVIVRVLT
jgi:hypothetical protein